MTEIEATLLHQIPFDTYPKERLRMHASLHSNPLQGYKKRKKNPPRKYETLTQQVDIWPSHSFLREFKSRLCCTKGR